MWTRFIWGGEHHMNKVHLGRRTPRGRGLSGEESTEWTRFIWGGQHHVDKVHLGRRAPHGRGSSGEESTTWTRFIWGGEHHVDEVHLRRRGREADLADSQWQTSMIKEGCVCDSSLCCEGDVQLGVHSQHGLHCPHINRVGHPTSGWGCVCSHSPK